MTQKDFKRYMRRGLGRCYTYLRDSNDADRYKKIVLWGCLHNLSYDIQVEGTRAAYVYSLAKLYSDDDYFVSPIINKFNNLPKSQYVYREFANLCDLLALFAEGGNREALVALDEKRNEYLEFLVAKRSFRSYDYLRDRFERISVSMLGLKDTIELISDFGRLFIENKHYNADEFDWFIFRLNEYYGKSRIKSLLKNESKKNGSVAAFFDSYKKISDPDVRKRLKRLSDVDAEELVDRLLAETDPEKKADILFLIRFKKNIPARVHGDIIKYARSEDSKLSERALYALTYCRSDAVYDFALSILDSDKNTEAVEMLLMNYRPEIDARLFEIIKSYEIDYDSTYDWHSVTSAVIAASDAGARIPKKYLLYVYENTLCSYCRNNAVTALSKRRWLSSDIIEECRYDSNDETVAYVNRYHKNK